MIEETIQKIEQQIERASAIQPDAKAELLKAVATLKEEIAHLSKTHGEAAQSITGLAELSTQEATREIQNPQHLKHSIDDLEASVAGFEESHPQLVRIVNRICETLSNLGV